MIPSRRKFLLTAGATALAAQLDANLISSSFAADYEFKIGYHAITWGDTTEQAINEISELGFRGVEIRRSDYEKYAGRAAEFKELMAAKKLTLVSISTGDITINPGAEKQEIADRVAMAKWMKEAGGLYLQVTDGARAKEGVNDLDDYKRLGRRLNEIGKRTFGEFGVKLGYHNSMNSMGERRLEVDRIMNATDPKHVWVAPDIAHMHSAGGDPVQFTRDYLNRIAYSHFKDVLIQKTQSGLDGRPLRPKYDFVELGQGVVNITGALQIMKDFRYQGWIIIELDRVPLGRTPKESAMISKRFVEEKLKLKI
ncbi:MAG TPA: sugar phosphate isomerase/epimerase family protein [Blastocatellia bacterium]|nr:sugar phosphate isomerase/epimerase family protein [Blastocatellia bacterium]